MDLGNFSPFKLMLKTIAHQKAEDNKGIAS